MEIKKIKYVMLITYLDFSEGAVIKLISILDKF
jgi:hypothetical protein